MLDSELKEAPVRIVPVPDRASAYQDEWLAKAAIDRVRLFRRFNKVGRTWGDGMTVKAVWHIVKESARHIRVAKLAPHGCAADLCSAPPRIGRRATAVPVPSCGTFRCKRPNVTWLQAADSISCQ